MQEVFEKIIEKFKKVGNIQFSSFTKPLITVEDAIKIVEQVAAEYNNGWIPVEEWLQKIIDNMQTAYDVDKVMEQLEEYSNADEAERIGTIPVVELTDAIKIVKGGGVNDA